MGSKTVRVFCGSITFALAVNLYPPTYALEDTSDSNSHSIVDIANEDGYSTADTDAEVSLPSAPAQENTAASDIRMTAEEQEAAFRATHYLMRDGRGDEYYASTTDKDSCTTADGQPGQYFRTWMQPDDGNDYTSYYNTSGIGTYCTPVETRTLTANNPGEPRKPSPAEMLQEIEDKFANTDIRPPILKQSYNSGSGTGRAKGDPNIYKGDNVNFYAEAPTAYWEGELSAGHVEIESYPVQMTVQYGNGDEGTSYTIGEPIYPKSGSKARPTATSYVYKRSGNFHAYATVSYAGRYRVNGGPWQAMRTVVKKDTADPLLIRVWWVDVGRVAGDCSYDDTRWGCKNDPTMGKKDNPNPRLRKADIRTGQRWHLNDSGDGDTEYSLHRDWPDM
ncbi:peptide ABC transporter ATPase [Rothia mucilaginosa]|uniref:peptide ABC transporter ATPase n=1 Tax=Rothia mucilaginosa TaxID=43675 RepID=UPI001C12AA2C|nr:peptide ABC transporter ATPase [Rothia mucilaginosa]